MAFPHARLAAAFATLPLIAAADWLTGTAYDCSVFYALPILLAAWYSGGVAGGIAMAGAGAAWIADSCLGRQDPPAIAALLWIALVRMGFYLILIFLALALKRAEARKREAEKLATEAQAAQARAVAQMAASELAAAAIIQEGFFPKEAPADCRLELYGICVPMASIGGDFYDWFPAGGGRTALVIGDVVGHGLSAALFMTAISGVLKSKLELWGRGDLPGIMTAVNNQISGFASGGEFATICLCLYDPVKEKLAWCNAGHNPPLILGASGGFRELPPTGPMAGILPGISYGMRSEDFATGDTLALFTDGVTETFSPSSEQFGAERLKSCLAGGPRPGAGTSARDSTAQRLAAKVLAQAEAFGGGAPPADDRTIIVAQPI